MALYIGDIGFILALRVHAFTTLIDTGRVRT